MFDTCSFKPTNDGFPPSSGGGGGAVDSVFGRTGVVIAVAGDYNSTQITNDSGVPGYGTTVTDAITSIFFTKLENTLNSGQIFVGNASNIATAVSMSGDITISNTGVTTIGNDKVTTVKILDKNVTYAKIQDVTTNKLIGRATAGSGVLEEITLGTNLSFTGTTLNAAGGGGYTYSAITLSVDTTYNKAALGGANYLVIQTNSATARTFQIGTGFSANDFILFSFAEGSPGVINLTDGVGTYNANKGNSILAIYNGSDWIYQTLGNSNDSSGVATTGMALGLGASSTSATGIAIGRNVVAGDNVVSIGSSVTNSSGIRGVVIGNSTTLSANDGVVIGWGSQATGASSISIGASTTGSGANSIRIGSAVSTGTNTGVVAIGQGITSTNTDAVVIGRAASAGGGGVTIGASSTASGTSSVTVGKASNASGSSSVTVGSGSGGSGANTVRIGNDISTSINTGVVAIGYGIISSNQDDVIIGRVAVGGGGGAVVIGQAATGSANSAIAIGQNASVTNGLGIAIGNAANTNQSYGLCLGYAATATSEMRQIALGALSFPRHYGAISRRIDTNTALIDATTPARHDDSSSWSGQTTTATPKILTLFDVTNKRLTLQANEALHFDIMITAKQTGSTNTLIRRIAGGAVRGSGAGSTTIVGQTTLYTHGTALTTTVSADTGNDAVQIQVTGDANTWEWTCKVDYTRTRTA